MSTSESGATWLSLLNEKKQQIKDCCGQDYSVPRKISSGRSFRLAFEEFGSRKGEHKLPPLENKLIGSITPISELFRAVDQSTPDLQKLAPNETLEGLVWGVSFAIIECGCKAGAQLNPLINLISELNRKVPRFAAGVGHFSLRFPNEDRVQKPLQDVYSLFINSHVFIISYLKATINANLTNDEALATHITETAGRLEEARGRYDVMVNQVAEDEERKRRDQEQPSLDAQRSLPDHLHDNSTSNREVKVLFVSMKSLGNGSYGEVDEVRELSTGASYARKHIHLDPYKLPDVTADEVKNEVATMQKLRHHHIATVLFYMKEENAYSIFMLPVAEYDLQQFLSYCTNEEYDIALTKLINPWFGCLLDALAYAHKMRIKHQDIKPSNILIKNNQPYLSDFGLAKDFTELDASTSRGQKVKGTPIYRAPEIKPNHRRGFKADVFSLGCVYSEMFTVTQGKSVEEYRDFRQTADSIAFRDCLVRVGDWLKTFEKKKRSDLLVNQIFCMITEEDKPRHTAEQALNYLKPEPTFFCVE